MPSTPTGDLRLGHLLDATGVDLTDIVDSTRPYVASIPRHA